MTLSVRVRFSCSDAAIRVGLVCCRATLIFCSAATKGTVSEKESSENSESSENFCSERKCLKPYLQRLDLIAEHLKGRNARALEGRNARERRQCEMKRFFAPFLKQCLRRWNHKGKAVK